VRDAAIMLVIPALFPFLIVADVLCDLLEYRR
jgi:hypothetical protein